MVRLQYLVKGTLKAARVNSQGVFDDLLVLHESYVGGEKLEALIVLGGKEPR